MSISIYARAVLVEECMAIAGRSVARPHRFRKALERLPLGELSRVRGRLLDRLDLPRGVGNVDGLVEANIIGRRC